MVEFNYGVDFVQTVFNCSYLQKIKMYLLNSIIITVKHNHENIMK